MSQKAKQARKTSTKKAGAPSKGWRTWIKNPRTLAAIAGIGLVGGLAVKGIERRQNEVPVPSLRQEAPSKIGELKISQAELEQYFNDIRTHNANVVEQHGESIMRTTGITPEQLGHLFNISNHNGDLLDKTIGIIHKYGTDRATINGLKEKAKFEGGLPNEEMSITHFLQELVMSSQNYPRTAELARKIRSAKTNPAESVTRDLKARLGKEYSALELKERKIDFMELIQSLPRYEPRQEHKREKFIMGPGRRAPSFATRPTGGRAYTPISPPRWSSKNSRRPV